MAAISFSNRTATSNPANPVKAAVDAAPPTSALQPSIVRSKETSPARPSIAGSKGAGCRVDVENFVPDAGDFDNFLDDENSAGSGNTAPLDNVPGGMDSRLELGICW